LKRSNAPVFWLLFGARGMLSALLGPMLVFITGIAVPMGWPLPSNLMTYPRMLAFAQNWPAMFSFSSSSRCLHGMRRTASLPRETPRLCRGGSRGLTFEGVHRRNFQP
jgi:fumarate reductase subunit D